jgi:ArsR family transcriptional regulator, arsenate/arsenite/antimonite-responsive transcriptional repressor
MKMGLSDAQFHRIAKVLADPRRFEILTRIANCKELACNDLKECVPITPATLSHHVKELADADLVDVRRQGKFMHLKLRRDVWKEYLSRLAKL